MSLVKLQQELKKYARKDKADFLPRFFKCGKGEYGEGDIFIGVNNPTMRKLAKKFVNLDFKGLGELIKSKIHEQRQIALFILTIKYQKAKNQTEKKICVDFYLKNLSGVNNWDLVDLSCYKLLGDWLLDKPRIILYDLACSDNLWQKRIAIIATYAFIRQNDFKDTIKISKILLSDKHDLIHKAVGWMLREMGKRNLSALEKFLQPVYKKMPRTTLRYAIEKMSDKKRKFYLAK